MRGISLIEVLASIFIVSVGLLGVLAVIPFGAFQVSEANHAGYASNMLLNAVEEIALRKLAQPETWNVGELISGTGANKETVYTQVGTFDPTEATLNCTRILWVETRGMRDIPPHIFTIGSTFDNWSELMRGQDDLVQTTNEESDRPQLVLNEKGKPMSSGKYEWCFTYKPETKAVTEARWVAKVLVSDRRVPIDGETINVEEVIVQDDPSTPNDETEKKTKNYQLYFVLTTDENEKNTVLQEIYDKIAEKNYPKQSPFELDQHNLDYVITLAHSFAWAKGKIQYRRPDDDTYHDPDSPEVLTDARKNKLRSNMLPASRDVIDHTAPVDVIACYQRAPDEDMLAVPADFDITYSPASKSGTITFHDPKFLQALETTKYVFLTWGTDHASVGGTWCRIVFLAKGENPKIIITGDVNANINNMPNLHVYIPSGAVYHKHIDSMPIWEH